MSNSERHGALRNPQDWLLAVLVVVAVLVSAYALHGRGAPDVAVADPRPSPAAPVAFFFGDSYFNGANGVPLTKTMAFIAGQRLGYDPAIGGHGGTGFVTKERPPGTAKNYLDQVSDGALAIPRADDVRLVVLEGGLNDVGQPRASVRAAAEQMLRTMKRTFPTAKLVLVGPCAPTGGVSPPLAAVVGALRDATTAVGVPFVDAEAWITPGNVQTVIGSDGTHPSAAGHQVLSGELEKALRALRV